MNLVENESPRGAVTGHTFEQKEPRRRKEKNKHRFWKTCGEALKRQDSRMLVFVVWLYENDHSRGIWVLSKANELKADLPTSKLSFQIPSWAETSCKTPKAPWKFVWRNLALTKLKPPQSLSPAELLMLHFSPLLGSASPWMLKTRMSLHFLFHSHNQLNSGWRQSTHWPRELF